MRFAILIVGILAAALFFPAQSATGDSNSPELISYSDAEILVYLLPVARETRSQGSDVTWERTTSEALNQQDYYFFWLYNKKINHNGSPHIGNYAVNKHTAEIWDDDEGFMISDRELDGVERILRKSHRISLETIVKYHSVTREMP